MGKHKPMDPSVIYVHGLPYAKPSYKKYKKTGIAITTHLSLFNSNSFKYI